MRNDVREPDLGLAYSRPSVHVASGKRLGDAHPRQEGPTDLRLVPPALAAWVTVAVTLDAPPGWVAGAVAVCLMGAGAVLWARRRGTRHGQGRGPGRSSAPPRLAWPRATVAAVGPGWSSAPPRLAWPRATVAAVLLCVAAAAVSAGLHGADLRRGPVPGLAQQFATVTAEVQVTSDARLTRPRINGDHMAPTSVLINADVRRVEAGDGTAVTTRAPVLLIVDAGRNASRPATESPHDGGSGPPSAHRWPQAPSAERGSGPPSAGRTSGPPLANRTSGPPTTGREAGRSPWLDLLPSTRVRVTARLAPALTGGDRIAAVLRVRDVAPEVVGEPSAAQRFAGRLRAGLREATDGLPGDARALLPGLVVGDTSRITPELDEAFKATDLAHTLAVSGSNLTIILALLVGPPGLARLAERRGLAPRLGMSLRTTALFGGALTLGFVVVCRPDPSVLRAAACGAIALLALATGRRRSLIPALATAVLLLVLYDPWLARSYGFLLSVLATGALLTLAPRWSEALRRRRVPPRLAEALAAAGAAQALCAPVVAVLSARVSLVAVPCNLLAEFAVAPATVLGFAALAVAPVAMPVAKALAWCASWPAGWIADVARTGAALPGSGVDWPGSWAGAALLALVTMAALPVGRRLVRHPGWCAACGALLLLAVVQPPPLTRAVTGWPPPGWRFVMCDVGQGDATVLAAGEGTGVVVDAGPDPALVDRCLRTLGITRIPLVVLTHFHADHVAGLPGVLRGRAVGAIETTGYEEPVDQVEFVRREAAARRIPLTRAVAGERRRTGGLSWEVLWPPAGSGSPPSSGSASASGAALTSGAAPTASASAWASASKLAWASGAALTSRPPRGSAAPRHPATSPSSGLRPGGELPSSLPPPVLEGPNDASVTLLVRSAGLRLLLLGDLEPPSQQALLRSPAGDLLSGVDMLKVAHHGSAYQDPELIRRAAPRLALISCGEGNPYGHPAPRTVAALRAQGAAVLRTDEDGALAVVGAGRELGVAGDWGHGFR